MASIPKWTIEFDPAAQRELDRLDKPIARRISKFLHERVRQLDDPHKIGERLTGTLSDLWRYRAGDYRIYLLVRARPADFFGSAHRTPAGNLQTLSGASLGRVRRGHSNLFAT